MAQATSGPPFMLAALPVSNVIEVEARSAGQEDSNVRWFNGRPVRPARKLAMLVTAYSPDAASCGESADGITASGYSVWTNGMKLVAADTSILPFGSLISVPGYDDGNIVPVLDRGGAIKGHRLDLLYPTHEQAEQWGAQRLEVTVWEYADGRGTDFEIRYNSASALQ
jgi:3D (Asp-Asp-Asp) domain-containing protein